MTMMMTAKSLLRSAATVATVLVLATLPARAEVAIQQVTSPKGITAWLVEDYSVPLISLRFAFDGGSTQDQPGKEGTANLITALFDEGAGDLDSEAFQIKLDDAGAEMGFSASKDSIYGSMRMLADQKVQAMGLLKMALETPRFDQNPIDRMRAQIVSGIIADAQDPQTKASDEFTKALFGDHPYARKSDGTIDTLKTITADDLRAFHKAVFARDHLTIAVVGAIDAETLKGDLDNLFGNLPEKADLKPIPDMTPTLGQDLHVEYNLPQTSISLAYPGVARSAKDYLATYVMNEILGGDGYFARLTAEVREKRGLTYGISSSMLNLDHANALVIGTSTRADRALETQKVMQDVIAGMAKDGPTEAELAEAKKYVIGSYAISQLDNSMSIAGTLLGLQINHLGADYIERRGALINAISVADVKAMATRLLSTKPLLLTVGPKPAAP